MTTTNEHTERAELTPEFIADRVPQTATILELEDGTRKTCMTYSELKQFAAAMLEAQPAREWLGLTVDKFYQIWNESDTVYAAMNAVDALLIEKNAGQPAADDKAGGEPVAAQRRVFNKGEWGPWYEIPLSIAGDSCRDVVQTRLLYTHPQPQDEVRVPDGYVLVPESALRWLFGEEGAFECPPEKYFRGKPPAYWWRSVFRDMLAVAPKPQEDLPAILKKQAS